MSLLQSSVVILTLGGCSRTRPTGILAPDVPLGQAEQSLLKQIRDTPAPDRTIFVNKHRAEVMQLAAKNRAFGEQLNQILGVHPAGTR